MPLLLFLRWLVQNYRCELTLSKLVPITDTKCTDGYTPSGSINVAFSGANIIMSSSSLEGQGSFSIGALIQAEGGGVGNAAGGQGVGSVGVKGAGGFRWSFD